MAITKSTTLERIEILKPVNAGGDASNSNDANYRITVTYLDVLDDSSDADLPISSERTKHFFRYDENGDDTNLGSEAEIVQNVAGALWSS